MGLVEYKGDIHLVEDSFEENWIARKVDHVVTATGSRYNIDIELPTVKIKKHEVEPLSSEHDPLEIIRQLFKLNEN